MNIPTIYVHINPLGLPFSNELDRSNLTFAALPEYAQYSFQSVVKYTSKEPVIITDTKPYEKELVDFFERCKAGFPSFYKDPFWLLTLMRLYIVHLYIKNNNINKFVHMEYDNLIFDSYDCLKELEPSIYFTRVGPECGSAGFVYCNSIEHFDRFISKILEILRKGEAHLRKFTQYGQLSEMIMIDLINTHTTDVIKYLPLFPNNYQYDITRIVFDGASYGQYLGGTNCGDPPGWYGSHHYVGQMIQQKKLEIYFDKAPHIKFCNRDCRVLNPHLHSKNLKAFV